MTLETSCVLLSSSSFIAYGISYFTSPHMKNEFKRFKLEKIGLITILLQFLGATGLILGLRFNPLLISSALGLGLLMLIGLLVRIKSKDSIRISLPALFFLFLNGYIFITAIS